MKEGIHPENYRHIVFSDVGAGVAWLTRSTVKTEKTIKWEDGKEYPLRTSDLKDSHPFYTGQHRLVDTEGRVDKFNKKYGRAKSA